MALTIWDGIDVAVLYGAGMAKAARVLAAVKRDGWIETRRSGSHRVLARATSSASGPTMADESREETQHASALTVAARARAGYALAWRRAGARTMAGMRLADKVLAHQVHPVKIGADLTASVVSNVLLWKAYPKAAIAVRVLLPVTGSAAVLGLADLDALAMTRRGQYVLAQMPPSAQVVRLAGDALMGLGARRHSPALLLAGAAVIVAGWSHAAWPRPLRRGMTITACRSPVFRHSA